MMRKVRNWLNYSDDMYMGLSSSMPSKTVPDMAMTVKEIIARFANGQSVPGSKVPLFNEDNRWPDPATMDLADREAMQDQLHEELAVLSRRKARIEAEKAKRAKKASAEQITSYLAELRKLEAPETPGTNVP